MPAADLSSVRLEAETNAAGRSQCRKWCKRSRGETHAWRSPSVIYMDVLYTPVRGWMALHASGRRGMLRPEPGVIERAWHCVTGGVGGCALRRGRWWICGGPRPRRRGARGDGAAAPTAARPRGRARRRRRSRCPRWRPRPWQGRPRGDRGSALGPAPKWPPAERSMHWSRAQGPNRGPRSAAVTAALLRTHTSRMRRRHNSPRSCALYSHAWGGDCFVARGGGAPRPVACRRCRSGSVAFPARPTQRPRS